MTWRGIRDAIARWLSPQMARDAERYFHLRHVFLEDAIRYLDCEEFPDAHETAQWLIQQDLWAWRKTPTVIVPFLPRRMVDFREHLRRHKSRRTEYRFIVGNPPDKRLEKWLEAAWHGPRRHANAVRDPQERIGELLAANNAELERRRMAEFCAAKWESAFDAERRRYDALADGFWRVVDGAQLGGDLPSEELVTLRLIVNRLKTAEAAIAVENQGGENG